VTDWRRYLAEAKPKPLAGTLRRLVESQEQVATNGLVRSLHRQAALEEMLEATKPALRRGTEHLHYLLAAPFRYPPLPHGSRFGSRTEPSLFYGSLNPETVLAEAAYYRFVFWSGMTTPPAEKYVTQHTLFGAEYRTARGLNLREPPFARLQKQLTDPADYSASQQLGAALRAAGVEAFEYQSARDPARGSNLALFTPCALSQPAPSSFESWLCETAGEQVRFYARQGAGVHVFPLALFLLKGKLPQPAV
jgi:hypothetical protein